MLKAISCVVRMNEQFEKIVIELLFAGFSGEKISVLVPARIETKKWLERKKKTDAPVTPGAFPKWLFGIATLAIPGVGPFFAAGPIVTILSMHSRGALGSLTRTLIDLGILEYEAQIFENKIKQGLILISVDAHDLENEKKKRVCEIFNIVPASDISEECVETHFL